MDRIFLHIILLLFSFGAGAQSGYLPLGELSYQYFERLAVINGDSATSELGVYPIRRDRINQAVDRIYSTGQESFQLDYLAIENDELVDFNTIGKREKPFLKFFYKNKGQALAHQSKNFGFVLNPILYFKYSNNQTSGDPVFQNTRGLALHGHIDQKVYFQSSIFENQSSFPDYAEARMDRDTFVQGNGFNKSYTSNIFNIDSGRDYLNATGRVGFKITRSIDVSYGYDRNFIGSGFRSLFLSDFSNNYSNLKISTKVWKIHYQNIFAEFFNNGGFSNVEKTREKKYFSGHYLKFNINPNIHIGFFEGVIYSGDLGLQPSLINPIIFYRSIEGFANREGNAMLGLDFRVNLLKRFSIYGQLIFDEFKFDEVFGDPPGWWANKYGIQAGVKYFNIFGIENLDGLVEYNRIRPYTYGHITKITSYSNFNQPMAHPIGANLKEVIGVLKYTFREKWSLDFTAMRMSYGEDTENTYWGTNILIPYTEREQDYNNTTSQGIDTDVWLYNINLSYRFGHDLFVDLEYNLRQQVSDLAERDNTQSYIGFAVRMNIARLRHNY